MNKSSMRMWKIFEKKLRRFFNNQSSSSPSRPQSVSGGVRRSSNAPQNRLSAADPLQPTSPSSSESHNETPSARNKYLMAASPTSAEVRATTTWKPLSLDAVENLRLYRPLLPILR
uniref:Uncharacterized protein n=1 Tax=Ascaris lumbricoides TaxID=6252 RepID=A0A0M3HPD3_ASCLU